MSYPNAHRVVLTFDGTLSAELVCPEGDCDPVTICGECERDIHDSESPPCEACKDGLPGAPDCWVRTWFESVEPEELLHGTVEVTVEPEWDDGCLLHIVEPGAAA